MTLHPLLARVFAAWEEAGVVWAVLRAPENPARPEGDIDILLERRTAHTAERVAWDVGFVTVPDRVHDLHLLQYDRESGHWIWLHCATELAFGATRAVRPGFENRWLADRRAAGRFVVLAPGEEFWITLMHALLDQGTLSERSRRRLLAGIADASPEGPLPDALRTVLPPGWTPNQLLERMRSGDWEALQRIAPMLRASAARAGRPVLPMRAWRWMRRALTGVRSARHRRGVGVALLGPDGAGKSTLGAALRQGFVLPAREVYMGLTGGWLRHVDKLRVPGVVRAGRFLVIWGRYLRAQYHIHRGRLVVFDRYIYDAEVPTPFPLSRWGRLGRWLDGRTCPGPDIVMILDAPGTVMHERKGEYTPEMLEQWRQKFLTIRARHPNVVVLDATRSVDALRGEALDRIWACYQRRWARR